MGSDTGALDARREALLRRSTELRSGLVDNAAGISDHLRVVDTATSFLRSGRGRVVIWGGALLLLFVGPRNAVKVAGRGAILWSLIRRLLPAATAYRRGRSRD
jgi:YqjK-like protein